MQQLKLNYQVDNVDEIVLEIKSSDVIKPLIESLNLTDEEIIQNYELFYQYIKVNQSCLTCKGMKDCLHSTKGMQYGIKKY